MQTHIDHRQDQTVYQLSFSKVDTLLWNRNINLNELLYIFYQITFWHNQMQSKIIKWENNPTQKFSLVNNIWNIDL